MIYVKAWLQTSSTDREMIVPRRRQYNLEPSKY